MRENKVDLLESDRELVTFYYTHDKCILIDARVNEIIESGDSSRLENILTLLESFNDDKMFKSVSEKISTILNKKF
jgi:hypothetical protein